MSAAIAMPPSPAPHDRRPYNDLAPATTATSRNNSSMAPSANPSHASISTASIATINSTSPARSKSPVRNANQQAAKSSPPSASRTASGPKIVVKKEPGSPGFPPAPNTTATRHRPRKLDLSKSSLGGSGAATARPALGARDSLGIREVGLACLSPGFVTQDPAMKAQLAQSLDVREQQRRIIEARLQQQSGKGDVHDNGKDKDPNGFAARTPGMSRRNKAPPGLSIVAPSHEQFANERVIQSAPLGQTFTGRHAAYPAGRHQPSGLSNSSNVHHVPAQQTANRLPPISDVFRQDMSARQEPSAHQLHPASGHPPLSSPGLPPANAASHQAPPSSRSREYRSAEEAQQELAGGRTELLPKLVHYTGHQPPTPPSPRNGMSMDASRGNSKRRTRAEYEEGGSPPLGHGPSAQRPGPFGAGRDSPETQRQKKEEFLGLCARAWDLFHS